MKKTDAPPGTDAQQQPAAGTRLSAVEIHKNVLEPARKELVRPAASLFWSAVASGLVIGFSFLCAAFLSELGGSAVARAALAAAGYPIGFIFVIMARSELFTENTLVPVVPFLEHRDLETFGRMMRLWGLLLVGNLVGAVVFGSVLARTGVVRPELHEALARMAAESTEGGFGVVLYKAVFAGWLIALLAWLLAATTATGAQIALIWLCTAPIAALGFRHSIAGAVEAFYRAVRGQAGWGEALGGFIVPAVIGNAIGGVLLVALLNWGQVAAEREEERREEDAEQRR
jgi:formate/nitrite transporter FocA (FNT family)